MNRIWTVARREVAGFFDQATAYILVVAFLGLGLFLTFRTVYAAGIATMRPFFDVLPWLFAVFIPAMTMRSLAEEKRSGTLEWLMAQPLREYEVVVGKFLGNWIFALIALAGAFPASVGIVLLSEADPGIVVAQFVGGALLAAQGVGIGLWASSLTRNQITAFILGTAITFSLILIGTPVVSVGLPPSLSGALASLSVVTHFDNVARGVIDLRDVVYFLSTAALFLILAISIVSGQRLSRERGAWRRLRTGTGVLIGIVLVVNLLGGQIRGRLDLTRDNLYTLSDGTRQVLGELDDLVTIKLVMSSELPPELQPTVRDVQDLVRDLRRAAGGNLIVDEIDPGDSEEAAQEARSLGIQPTEFNVLRDDAFEVRPGWFGLALLYADESEAIPYIARTDDLEFRLVSTIDQLTTTERPTVAFLSGYGAQEPFNYPLLQQQLAPRFSLTTANMTDSTFTLSPDSTDVLVLAGTSQPLPATAVEKIRGFVEAGRPALLMLDPTQIGQQSPIANAVPTGLEDVITGWGVTLREGVVKDWASNMNVSLGRQGLFNVVRPYPLWPIAFADAEHPITRGLSNVSLGWASPLEITDSTRVTPLVHSSEASELHAPGGMILPESLGTPDETAFETFAVAAAIQNAGGDAGGRVVVIGDVDFLGEQFLRGNPQNVVFVANAIDWLTQDEALISIRSKTRTPPQLVFTSDVQRSLLKWANLAGVPLLFILVGALRVTGRRSRLEKRWKEFAE